MTTSKSAPGIWVGQLFHFASLAILLGLVFLAWRFLDEPFPDAFWIAVAFPIVHQVFVWLAWRLELLYSAIARSVGFRTYVASFFILFAGRFLSLLVLAWLDRGSLKLGTAPRIIITLLLSVAGIYAMYSVRRYFGMIRASGADHFDPRYRDMPLVRKGIFRFTNNGMYIYAFLLFWAIAVGFNSAAALTVAAFSHAYIWVHFYGTEKPDMKFVYGSNRAAT
jgi:hypothetical protein